MGHPAVMPLHEEVAVLDVLTLWPARPVAARSRSISGVLGQPRCAEVYVGGEACRSVVFSFSGSSLCGPRTSRATRSRLVQEPKLCCFSCYFALRCSHHSPNDRVCMPAPRARPDNRSCKDDVTTSAQTPVKLEIARAPYVFLASQTELPLPPA